MKHLILISAILLSCICHIYAGSNDYVMQWQKGNAFYQQKQYDSAAFYYEEIAAARPGDATVYCNLGNTYYRLNKIAPAVLNYQRTLHADPDNQQAKENLALTEARINNRIQRNGDIFFVRWWQALTRPNKANTYAVASLAAFIILIMLMAAKRMYRPGAYTLPRQLNGIFLVLSACFLLLSYIASQNSAQKTQAVVMENDAPLMNNEQKGKPILLIPAGTTVVIKSKKDTWTEVSLPDGRSGWLLENELTKI